ncbi:MAG: hypothetical protein Q4A32_08015, partial [Lachnospiraceae bacterium]|nr:hypothetical protein [Lachnospiraceae bacterium]
MSKNNISISVRTLVEFILRSGDIDNRSGGGFDQEAMLAGGRIHRKIQKGMAGDYRPEAALADEIDCGTYVLKVEGRADGVFTDDGSGKGAVKAEGAAANAPLVVVDEIKGIYMEPEELEGPVPVHLAQAKCYGAILLSRYLDEGWNGNPCRTDMIGIRMTYVNLENDSRMRYFTSVYTRDEILSWYGELCSQYRKWTDWQNYWQGVRDSSMEQLRFPFAYRKGQKGLVSSVYHTILEEKELFLMAPTGVGKTMAVVYPSVRAVGQGLADKVFYLTAKNQTLTVGAEAFRVLNGKGLRMKTILLTSKEKICPFSEPSCNPDDCPYAKGHFDRVNDAVFELLGKSGFSDLGDGCAVQGAFVKDGKCVMQDSFDKDSKSAAQGLTDKTCRHVVPGSFDKEGKCEVPESFDRDAGHVQPDFYDRDTIRAHADKWKVCPFELSLDISTWCDAVLCDYNYAFDPNARLRRFFGEGVKGRYILLVDEAHNLVDRTREMYSAELVKEDVLAAKNAIKGASPKIARQIERLNRLMLQMRKKLTAKEDGESDRLGRYVKIDELDEKFVWETLGTYGMMQEYFKERSGLERNGEAEDSVDDGSSMPHISEPG